MPVFSKRWTRPPETFSKPRGAVWSRNGPRAAGAAILVTYVAVGVLSYAALRKPGELGLSFGRCDEGSCVAWVMPAGHAWQDGARPGMRLVTRDGRAGVALPDSGPLAEAELVSAQGERVVARVRGGPFKNPWARISVWLTGAVFALVGAAVLVRRPDALVARLFGFFCGVTAIALGVAPAAGGPHPPWSLVVQLLSLLAVAATLPAFAAAFVGAWDRLRGSLGRFWIGGGVLTAGYVVSLALRPSFYDIVRVGLVVYVAGGVLGSVAVLAWRASGRRSGRPRRDARLALSGIACGTLPFVGVTLIPQTASSRDLLPAHLVTVVLWSVIPMTFAYAILRHHIFGIRRLVHRGMVHVITSVLLMLLMVLVVLAANPLVAEYLDPVHPALATALLLGLGAVLFHPARRGVRRLVDRFLYQDEVDSETLLEGMRCDLLGNRTAEEVVAAMVRRFNDSMQLEAAILFLETTGGTIRVAASAGARAEEVVGFLGPALSDLSFDGEGLSELRWRADRLLVARLAAGSDRLGYLVLGPKEGGEVFLHEERRLVETVSPILALAIRETTLLAELRAVSERLTSAQEAERARIARDLHDGPLQKAILLTAGDTTLRDRDGVARGLASELRELCARLRPAILDDLGLVPALDWLLEQTARGFVVTPRLTLRGMSEDDRLAPGTELALFRIAQEAVSNALRHGHAKCIDVSLSRSFEGVQLCITDDGRGLAGGGDSTRGLGIPGMRERVRQVGGSVAVCSNGSGTIVTARIPHHAEARL